jgi:hypothetical protein
VSRPLCQIACLNVSASQKGAKAQCNSFEEIVAALNAIVDIGGFNFCAGVTLASRGQHDIPSCGEGFLSLVGAEGPSCLQQSISGVSPGCVPCACLLVEAASTGCMQPITHAAAAIHNESPIRKTLVISVERIDAII